MRDGDPPRLGARRSRSATTRAATHRALVDRLSDEELERLNELLPWRCFTVDSHGRPFGGAAWRGKRDRPAGDPRPADRALPRALRPLGQARARDRVLRRGPHDRAVRARRAGHGGRRARRERRQDDRALRLLRRQRPRVVRLRRRGATRTTSSSRPTSATTSACSTTSTIRSRTSAGSGLDLARR